MKAPTAILAPILGLLGLTLCAAPALADPNCEGPDSATTLTVQVSGMNSARGEMAITVYGSDSKKFLAPKGKLLRVRPQAVAPTTQACFNLPGPGTYAVAVYHDANANEDFDRSVIGMPTEGFGFSNDAPTKFGLPAFEAVRFSVKAGSNLTRIKLRYVK
jgi:uncharacterized protein (DUF2141 family)